MPSLFGKNDECQWIGRSSSRRRLEIHLADVVADRQPRERRVPEPPAGHELEDLVTTRGPAAAEDTDRADTVGRGVPRLLELERLDR